MRQKFRSTDMTEEVEVVMLGFCNNASHGRKFSCWDDDRDISSDNPECDCGHVGRMFMAHGGAFYGCPIGTCSWIIHSSCILDDVPNDDADDVDDSVADAEIRADTNVECTVTSRPGEAPLCTICHLVLERLRRPHDIVTTIVTPEERSALGCHLCTLFLRYPNGPRSWVRVTHCQTTTSDTNTMQWTLNKRTSSCCDMKKARSMSCTNG